MLASIISTVFLGSVPFKVPPSSRAAPSTESTIRTKRPEKSWKVLPQLISTLSRNQVPEKILARSALSPGKLERSGQEPAEPTLQMTKCHRLSETEAEALVPSYTTSRAFAVGLLASTL